MFKYIKSSEFLPILFLSIFLIIPFFWLKPGEMDLGGDSSRLYFYDPISYLKSFGIYGISPEGMGDVAPNHYFLPYVLLIAGIKLIVNSSYFLITFINVLKLAGGFLTMFFVIYEILKITPFKNEKKKISIYRFSSLLGALFYILSPISIGNWDKALTSHNQIFLNPLMFLLVLKFFTTNNFKYIWLGLLISLFFAPNFAFTSAPPFFSFYPLSLFFLSLMLFITKTSKISWKKIIIIFLMFLGLHAFHLIPQIVNLFEPGSYANTRVFDKQSIAHEGIRYFYGVLPLAKVSFNILLPNLNSIFSIVYVLVPFSIILALILNKKINKVFLLIGMFFLLTLYLLSANITSIGVEFYKNLFYIPGFSMFRNFIGQWGMIYIFFYALLFGFAIKTIFSRLTYSAYKHITIFIAILFFVSSWGFLRGDQINKTHATSNNIKIPIEIDPNYIKTLNFIKKIPDEGKILILPFSDSFYQVIAGKEGGAYVGSSSISYLTDKKSFSGYQIMTPAFSERFLIMSKEKDYEGIKRLLTYLNIKYIFYNSDPRIYDKDFPSSPYSYVRQYLPNTQKEYKKFVPRISENKIFESGTFQIFEVNRNNYLPLFYVAENISFYKSLNDKNLYDPSLFIQNKNNYLRTVYFDSKLCPEFAITNNCSKDLSSLIIPDISFSKVDPTKYVVNVRNARDSYFLVFGNAYHPKWKIFLSDIQFNKVDSKIINVRHLEGNGYANVWYITPQDVNDLKNYKLIIEMTDQRIFYYSFLISFTIFLFLLIWGLKLFFPRGITDIIKKFNA